MNCAPPGAGPIDADRLVAALQHDFERIDDRRPHRHRAHVDVMIDLRRQIGAGQQAALLAHLDGDRARADAAEDLPRQRIRHHARGRGIEHQRGGIRRRQPVVEPVDPEIGDRGHVDQHFRDHHQRNREQQQLAGQAEPPRTGSAFALLALASDTISASDLRSFRMRPAPEPVKLRIANVCQIHASREPGCATPRPAHSQSS